MGEDVGEEERGGVGWLDIKKSTQEVYSEISMGSQVWYSILHFIRHFLTCYIHFLLSHIFLGVLTS